MTDPVLLRKSGGTFAFAFALLALLARDVPVLPFALLTAASTALALAILKPSLLERPTRRWLQLGEAMHKVVNPLVLGLLYLALIVPTGVLRRLVAEDPMQRRPDPSLASYWIECEDREYTLDAFGRPY